MLLHEFGHVLGLDHTTPLPGSIMAPAITNVDTLQADDIAGVVALYGTPNGLPLILSSLDVQTIVNQTFNYSLVAVGGVTSKTLTGLPAGLGFDRSLGLIYGTPNQPGTYPFAFTASDDRGTTSATLTLTVLGEPPVIPNNAAATATVGQPFRFQVTGTEHPNRYSFDSTPFGLTYDTGTGVVSARPRGTGRP